LQQPNRNNYVQARFDEGEEPLVGFLQLHPILLVLPSPIHRYIKENNYGKCTKRIQGSPYEYYLVQLLALELFL
jgi:hypothetical protein